MYRVKKKYLGKTLKHNGVSVKLEEDMPQAHMRYVFNKQIWGKKYITLVKEKITDDKNTEIPSE